MTGCQLRSGTLASMSKPGLTALMLLSLGLQAVGFALLMTVFMFAGWVLLGG